MGQTFLSSSYDFMFDRIICVLVRIDLCHSTAMLSLGRIKSFVFTRLVSPRREFSARLVVQKQSFLFSRDSTWPPSDKALLRLGDTL